MIGQVHRVAVLMLAGSLLSGCAAAGWLGGIGGRTLEEQAVSAPEGLENRITREGEKPNGKVDHFAVLVGANTELRHRGNLSMAYQVLVEQGYSRESIYILESEGETLFFPTTDRTTRESMHRLFDHLRRVVEPQDTLLIYVTGHGRRVTAEEDANGERSKIGVSTILLNSKEEMSQFEFATLLEGIDPAVAIAFFDQCYGEIFSTIAKSCNFVFITTAAEDETSYGVTFPRAFWGAFRERQLGATSPSVAQAFESARDSDKGTKMGYNRPKMNHGCVNAQALTLLGDLRSLPVLSENEKGADAGPRFARRGLSPQ